MNPLVEEQEVGFTLTKAFKEIFKTFMRFVYFKFTEYYVIASLYTLLSYCYHEMDCVPISTFTGLRIQEKVKYSTSSRSLVSIPNTLFV